MAMHKTDNTNRKAFTLVELLVVIVILSLLTAIAAPRLWEQIDRSKWDLTKPKMKPIETAIDTYILNCKEYPITLNDLLSNPGIESWSGPYLKAEQLKDPWGNEYGYIANGTANPGSYDIVGYGKDGVFGGDGYDAEQYNN